MKGEKEMKILLLFIFVWCSSETITSSDMDPYCFQFTWLGPMYDNHSTVSINCTEYEGIPCIEPFVITSDSTPPDVTYMWNNLNHSTIGCPLRPGYVCIKYSFIYNNAILNSTHFCGKMIEDTTTAITSGCYSQKVSGHTVEACACRTMNGNIPCNTSIRNNFSVAIIFFIMLLTIFN